jgi:hypothetical protein
VQNATQPSEFAEQLHRSSSPTQELDFPSQRDKVGLVSQRLTLPESKIGPGTIAAALAAFSMAVLAHFFI